MWTEITDIVILGRNYWSSCRVICQTSPFNHLYIGIYHPSACILYLWIHRTDLIRTILGIINGCKLWQMQGYGMQRHFVCVVWDKLILIKYKCMDRRMWTEVVTKFLWIALFWKSNLYFTTKLSLYIARSAKKNHSRNAQSLKLDTIVWCRIKIDLCYIKGKSIISGTTQWNKNSCFPNIMVLFVFQISWFCFGGRFWK